MLPNSECTHAPSGMLLQAFGEFNRGEWYDCHETLEDLWVGSEYEMRWFSQGLLQVAVALLHWQNGNFGGAVSLLDSRTNYLRRVEPVCQRIEVGTLINDADICARELRALGPERMGELPEIVIPKLRLAPSST